MKLTDKACKNAKPASKQYKLTDGAGLYLLVKPNGSKIWQMKYAFLGKEKTFSVGQYPLVTLLSAREARDAAKKLLMQGIDPTKAKKQEKKGNEGLSMTSVFMPRPTPMSANPLAAASESRSSSAKVICSVRKRPVLPGPRQITAAGQRKIAPLLS